MIASMTGYGKATNDLNGLKITVQIKSLNSKGLDLNIKLPSIYREKELALRSAISAKLQRGKIDLMVMYENQEEVSKLKINKAIFKEHYATLKSLKEEVHHDEPSDLIRLVCQLPDVMSSEAKEASDDEWHLVEKTIDEAIENLMEFRNQEGVVLEDEFKLRVNNISSFLNQVNDFEDNRIIVVRERIAKQLEDLLSADNYDKDRLEQELIYYLEKYDITEEKVRLRGHCNYFLETMNADDMQGKKLGFISQEMGREINTLGSKANDVNIQKLVVMMKDELEKIKEQTLNTL